MKKIVITFALLLVFSVMLFSFLDVRIAKAEANTIVVPDDYSTIQEAVDNAFSGDTVFVKSGTYVNQSLAITKPLSLVGEDPQTTVIMGKSLDYFPAISFAIYFEANDVQISGFTVMTTAQVRGIFGSGNRTLIENNIIESRNNIGIGLWGDHSIITNNNLTGVGALHCSGSNNTITRNMINGTSIAIELAGSFNTISGNHLTKTDGIRVNGNSNIINSNNVRDGGIGILLNSGSHNVVFENSVTGNHGTGILIYNASNNLVRDNYIANNIGTEGQKNGYGISLSGTRYHAENNTFYRNTLINNSYNVRIEEPYYVNHWDNGSEGNYWDDYNGLDANGDGIGDTPYIIDENNQDNYPIINYLSIPEFPSWIILPLFLVASIAVTVYKKKLTISSQIH